MLIKLTDACDPRLEDYTNLTDLALRKKLEPELGLFMAESKNVITRALRSGIKARSFLLSPKWLDSLAPLLEEYCGAKDGGKTPIFVGEEPLLQSITGFHLHRGALAAMNRPLLPTVPKLVKDAHRIAILEGIVDHTNVGAIFRSAAALGVDAVLVTPNCADPLYRRSVRVSMGTVFQVPWTRINNWPSTDELTQCGFHTAALALTDNSIALDDFAASLACNSSDSKVALIFGTEGDGISKKVIAQADSVVRIPMAHGVDSLNVAAASAVVFWETRKK